MFREGQATATPLALPAIGWKCERIVFAACAACVGLALFGVAAFQAAVWWWPYPDHLAAPAPSATLVRDPDGVALAAFAAPDGQWRLPLRDGQVGQHLRDAVVAVEDARFFDHAGVDWRSACAAAWQNVAALRVRRGASTLTMQLHRLRDPRPRSLAAKLEQAVRARQIERTAGKHEILAEYLNRAPFGGNLVGAGAASWRYFGKPCDALSLGEAALLAGLPQNPNRYRPDRYPDRAKRRRDVVLDRMLACGMITPAQHEQARGEAVVATWRPLPQWREHGLTADGALPALVAMAGSRGDVTTSIRSGVQRPANELARAHLARLSPGGVSAAAVLVLDNDTGECLASVSLGDHGSGAVDLTRRPRSTGSVLKPLIYAAAFEAGVCAPDSVLDDAPAAWAGYVPRDYDRQFRGQMTAAEALAGSRNIPAMALLARTGPAHVRGVMASAGLSTLDRDDRTYGLSLAIGGAEATPMEVAAAYAGMTRGGIATDPALHPLSPVPGGEGQGEGPNVERRRLGFRPSPLPSPPSTREREESRFLSERACEMTLAAIAGPERTEVLSRDAARLNVAWKTGTSSGHRDAWCAAVTRRRTVVVWLGNAGGEASAALVGRDAAAPLALELIAAIDDVPAEWRTNPVSREPIVTAAAVVRPRQRLAIVSPAPSRAIRLSDDVPAEGQRVPLRFAGAADAGDVHWFVDGSHVGTASPSGAATLWWTPTPGTHEVRVVDASGRAAVSRIRVEGSSGDVAVPIARSGS